MGIPTLNLPLGYWPCSNIPKPGLQEYRAVYINQISKILDKISKPGEYSLFANSAGLKC